MRSWGQNPWLQEHAPQESCKDPFPQTRSRPDSSTWTSLLGYHRLTHNTQPHTRVGVFLAGAAACPSEDLSQPPRRAGRVHVPRCPACLPQSPGAGVPGLTFSPAVVRLLVIENLTKSCPAGIWSGPSGDTAILGICLSQRLWAEGVILSLKL